MNPSVMALVPAYAPDRDELLATIACLEAQDSSVDICLVDDGSPTPVADILSPRENLHIIRLEPNGGITPALRAGVEHAIARNYDFICRLDVGDIAYPNRVSAQLEHMRRNPQLDILGAFSKVIDPAGNLLFHHGTRGGPDGVRAYLWKNAPFKHSTFFIRTEALRRLGNYNAAWPVAQDYELLVRFSRQGQLDCLEQTLIDYVDDPRGLSTRKRNAQLRMRLKAMLAHPAPLQPRWYLGILRTLATMVTPHGLAKKISIASWGARQSGRAT